MKEKSIGFIISQENLEIFATQNKNIVKKIAESFKKVFVINVVNLKFGNLQLDVDPKNKDIFPSNIIYKNIKTSKEFITFFKDKDFVALQYLPKSPDYYRIYFLIKRMNIKNVLILNLGNFGNKQTVDWNMKFFFKAYKHFFDKGFYYLFRILTIINIFPKIDLLFHSDTEIIKALNNGISRKFENLFPFFKISFFRKIEKVNTVFFDYYARDKKKHEKKNIILYVDTPLDHPDRIKREGILNPSLEKEYYEKLSSFLIQISKIFEMEIFVSLHPKVKKENNYFKDFKISNQSTMEMIPKSEIIIFSLSSAILSAVMYKKKIINIKSALMGDYLNMINSKYTSALGLFSYDIDNELKIEKVKILEKMNLAISNYDNFILTKLNSDGEVLSDIKIVEKIKENFFK